ncbi:hypothetical protein MTP99_003082 [Tenebrio molitor]|nr:hypothetical protein MTP99_003082 [Tenebrio molitor]
MAKHVVIQDRQGDHTASVFLKESFRPVVLLWSYICTLKIWKAKMNLLPHNLQLLGSIPLRHRIVQSPREPSPLRFLVKQTPRPYLNIRADRVVPMRNNAVLVESRCASVLQLTQSDKLKELKLEARHLSKSWPKVQIMDIPESITKEALMDDLSRQNFSEAVPENFIGKMFKYGRKQQNTPGDHASNNTTWSSSTQRRGSSS